MQPEAVVPREVGQTGDIVHRAAVGCTAIGDDGKDGLGEMRGGGPCAHAPGLVRVDQDHLDIHHPRDRLDRTVRL